MKRNILILLGLNLSLNSNEKAFVAAPFIDAVGESKSEQEAYDKLGYGDECCQRAYQLLFNEVVEVVQIYEAEAEIKVPHIIRFNGVTKNYENNYFVLKENLVFLKDLTSKGLDKKLIPKPISTKYSSLKKCNKNTVTLIMPFYDDCSGVTFSAGTRFIFHNQTETGFDVYVFDKESFNFKSIFIPKDYCKTFVVKSHKERVVDFVNLLKKWAHPEEGFIPYVLGGSSFIGIKKEDSFHAIQTDCCPLYFRKLNQTTSASGFDCSCIISRAAQICGIPYFYKNTFTLGGNLAPLQENEMIKAGDLIWFPGHVIVISDIEKNLIIEARGYASGFGKVHEQPLNKIFEGINTFDELSDAFFNKEPLRLLTKEGTLRFIIKNFKILKFSSYITFPLREYNKLCLENRISA